MARLAIVSTIGVKDRDIFDLAVPRQFLFDKLSHQI